MAIPKIKEQDIIKALQYIDENGVLVTITGVEDLDEFPPNIEHEASMVIISMIVKSFLFIKVSKV